MNEKQEDVKRSVINGAPISNRRPSVGVRPMARQTTARPVVRPVQANPSRLASVAAKPSVQQSARPIPQQAATRPAPKPAQTPTQEPVQEPAKKADIKKANTEKPSNGSKNTKDAKGKNDKKNKNLIIGVCVGIGVLACIGIGVGVAVSNNNNNGSSNGDDVPVSGVVEENTEEIQKITDETVNKYTDIKVEGYQHVENESFTGDAVVISVKNVSEEEVSLAITMGAYDGDGNLLETSSMYAEGIQPGQTHVFNTFVFTQLTPEQLQSATYKVYKASTYSATGSGEAVENNAEGNVEQQEGEVTTDSSEVVENTEVTE